MISPRRGRLTNLFAEAGSQPARNLSGTHIGVPLQWAVSPPIQSGVAADPASPLVRLLCTENNPPCGRSPFPLLA